MDRELDLILDNFNEVEFGIESLIITLKTLEELYEGDKNIYLKAYLNLAVRNLQSLHKDLRKATTELDDYILKTTKNE